MNKNVRNLNMAESSHKLIVKNTYNNVKKDAKIRERKIWMLALTCPAGSSFGKLVTIIMQGSWQTVFSNK